MIRLPRTGLGTAPLGGLFEAVSDETAHATFELAWERGIRFFDTAPLYGLGLSEQRLGRFLADKPRDDFVLASKVGRLLRADAPPDPDQSHWRGVPPLNPVWDFSYDGVLRSVDESLERLGLDRIDVLHIHDPDDHYEEALRRRVPGARPAAQRGRDRRGRRRHEPGRDAAPVRARGRLRLLPRRRPLHAARPGRAARAAAGSASERDIAVIAGGVFNSGILAGGTTFDYRPAPPELLERAAQLEAVCARYDVPLAAAALQFPLRHPAVASVLLGPRSPAQLAQSLDLLDVQIPVELWAELSA